MPERKRELLRTIPNVLRARDYHLYLEGGKRLTDLWLQGGKAVLGHKPPMVLRELKNAGERGLFAPFPHPMERRFMKALEIFFPGRGFRFYTDESSLCRALERAGVLKNEGLPCRVERLQDPAFPEFDNHRPETGELNAGEGAVPLWRPFVETRGNYAPPSVFIPVLSWHLSPAVLVLERSAEAAFPAGDLLSPALLAPATRALHDLAAALKEKAPNRGSPRLPKIEKVFSGNKPAALWRRRGIYLTVRPDTNTDEYAGLFGRFLEGGFLIPPTWAEPAILPPSMSPGEEAKLAELLGKGL
jgi:hypothetical protein